MRDPYGLDRFVHAQEGVFQQVCSELEAGKKRSHWMWFIFPQIRGLGSSATAEHFAVGSVAEARAYLDHPVLGPRLRECCKLVNAVEGRTAEQIFGYPDWMKFRSSMTLFAQATDDNAVFLESLRKYFAGNPDAATLSRL